MKISSHRSGGHEERCASGLPCDFGVDAGALQLLGPAWPVARTCVAGRTCAFHFDAPAAARVLLLETCGNPPPPGLPLEQVSIATPSLNFINFATAVNFFSNT